LHERGLCRIARRVHEAYFLVALFAVTRGINVLTAGEHETADSVENS
jgi:hypothetical protein